MADKLITKTCSACEEEFETFDKGADQCEFCEEVDQINEAKKLLGKDAEGMEDYIVMGVRTDHSPEEVAEEVRTQRKRR